MTISTINYHKTISNHPDLSKIMGNLTYETLHFLHNEIKPNTMSVPSNLGGGQHGYLGSVVSPNAYSLIANTPFVCQVHPLNLIVHIAGTRHAQEELKFQYEKNLWVFHETRGVERALIQKLVLSIKASYITAIRNSTTGQFTGILFMIIHYLIVTYGKISPNQQIDLEQNTKPM